LDLADVGGAPGDLSMSSYDMIANAGVGPLQDALSAECNDYYEATRKRDVERLAELDVEVPRLIEEFVETEAPGHRNPAWVEEIVRGNWAFAQQRYADARSHYACAWTHANDPDREARWGQERARGWQGMTANNLCNAHLKCHEYEEACRWGRVALELHPDNPVRHAMLGIAEHKAGRVDVGDQLLEHARRAARFDDERDPIAACLELESELHTIDSPVTRRIVAELEASGRRPAPPFPPPGATEP
jgi:tetratricopeptide (TPR) repeat protein